MPGPWTIACRYLASKYEVSKSHHTTLSTKYLLTCLDLDKYLCIYVYIKH